MATDTSQFTSLVTSEHSKALNFIATISALTAPFVDLTTTLLSMKTLCTDVDTAVGSQLDVIGQWVGFSRKLSVPIPDVFFSWDTVGLGWEEGSWRGPYEPSAGIVTLDDETYRAVLKGRIGSNYWDGSAKDLNDISTTAMASLGVISFVIDNFDMSVTIYILGTPGAALVELMKRGVIPPKPAGVRVAGYILASTPGAPFFALDTYTTPTVAGLDFGSFGDPI